MVFQGLGLRLLLFGGWAGLDVRVGVAASEDVGRHDEYVYVLGEQLSRRRGVVECAGASAAVGKVCG